MPELPEVETVRRGLAPAMTGATILAFEQRRDDLRFPLPPGLPSRLAGRRILTVGRRAKYLLLELDDGATLVSHLGMTGRFVIERDGEERIPGAFEARMDRHVRHDHLVLTLSGGSRITYNDVRRFGFIDLIAPGLLEANRHFAGMGPEPLGEAFDAAALARALRGKATPLKAALLDQSVVAGLGNIYVCEALFRAGLSPRRGAGTLVTRAGAPTARAERLVATIRAVLEEAIEAGGSTLRDFAATNGAQGYFQHRFRAYGREGEPCVGANCGRPLRRIVQAGRSTFFCPACQR